MKCCMMLGKQAGVVGLLTVLAKKHKVMGAVCYNDMTRKICREFDIPTIDSIHDLRFYSLLNGASLLISVHGREVIPNYILEACKCINVHPCLSKYKGKDPIKRLLKNGGKKASVGVHYISDRVDLGRVITESFIDVSDCKTEIEIYNKLYPIYSIVISEVLDKIKEV